MTSLGATGVKQVSFTWEEQPEKQGGCSMVTASRRAIAIALAGVALVVCSAEASAVRQKKAPSASATAKVDLNTASEKELEGLPGVGAATAKKIIAGRPYTSAADLAKAGVSKTTIDKIAPLVAVSAPASSSASGGAPVAKHPAASSTAAATGPVDLNTASEKELEDLPGVGPATAKKIIAGRPFASVGDLSKAGVSSGTIQKITPLVTVGAAAAASTPRSRPSVAAPAATATQPPPPPPPSPSSTAAASSRTTPAPSVQPPSPGMVWVNLDTKVYHRQGDRYYGTTKHGKWMTEADAIAAGYRASKTEPKK
jgi:DNA uptake protein ComE-like DNA-binding protein